MNLKAIEDEETQRRGLMVVVYNIGEDQKGPDSIWQKEGPDLENWLPLKIAAIHICIDNPLINMLARVFLLSAGESVRSRYKFHGGEYCACAFLRELGGFGCRCCGILIKKFLRVRPLSSIRSTTTGTATEINYKLTTFGLPIDSLPLTSQLELKKNNHTKWIAKQVAKEKFLKEKVGKKGVVFTKVDVPGCDDVLAGVGKFFQQHSGNHSHRELVLGALGRYTEAITKPEKDSVILDIVAQIRERGGRYLKKDTDGWWVEMTDEEAFQKSKKSFNNFQGKLSQSQSLGSKRIRIGLDPDHLEKSRFCL